MFGKCVLGHRYTNLLLILILLISGVSALGVQTSLYSTIYPSNINSPEAPASSVAELAPIDTLQPITPVAISTIPTAPISKTPQKQPTSTVCAKDYAILRIAGKTICMFYTNSLENDAGSKVAFYKDVFLYGHNTSAVFSILHTLPVGTTFSITKSGQTKTYKITAKQIFCDYSNPSYPCSNYPNDPVLNMYDVIQPSRKGAALSLMTCAGKSIGNGDATHRLVAWAVQI